MIDLERERDTYVAALTYLGPETYARVVGAMAAVELTFAPRLKTMGGWYWPRYCEHPLRGTLRMALIEVNPAETDEHQRLTLGHEIAHRLDHALLNGNAHGRGWRFWMKALRLVPARCHQYAELRGRRQEYAVACGDCGYVGKLDYIPWKCPAAGCGEREWLTIRTAISAAANGKSKR